MSRLSKSLLLTKNQAFATLREVLEDGGVKLPRYPVYKGGYYGEVERRSETGLMSGVQRFSAWHSTATA